MTTACDKCKYQRWLGRLDSPSDWRCRKVVLRTEFNANTGENDKILEICANVNRGDCAMFEEACPPWPPEKVFAGEEVVARGDSDYGTVFGRYGVDYEELVAWMEEQGLKNHTRLIRYSITNAEGSVVDSLDRDKPQTSG